MEAMQLILVQPTRTDIRLIDAPNQQRQPDASIINITPLNIDNNTQEDTISKSTAKYFIEANTKEVDIPSEK